MRYGVSLIRISILGALVPSDFDSQLVMLTAEIRLVKRLEHADSCVKAVW